jgi:hypothetical protein
VASLGKGGDAQVIILPTKSRTAVAGNGGHCR